VTSDFGTDRVERAASALRAEFGADPDALIVLGSGLADLVDSVQDPTVVDFGDVLGYPKPSVAGHSGRYVFGRLGGKNTLVQVGRFHAYEGHSTDVVVAPVRIAAALGVGTMIVTNATGGLHGGLPPGTVVLLDDHMNLMFRSPLAGPVHGAEGRFPDMSRSFDPELQALALEAAQKNGIELRRGVYAGVLGPNYETPAEVRMLASMGADVVGMSTVPEVITARALGMRVLGFSVVTNPAAGLGSGDNALTHHEVLEMGKGAASRLGTIVQGVLHGLE
jgi:purine-nucleoside phosphorylase